MEEKNKLVFVVAKKGNGNLAYAENDLPTEDALTMLAMATSYVYEVGTTRIGLTESECIDNITNAVQLGIDHAKAEQEQ